MEDYKTTPAGNKVEVRTGDDPLLTGGKRSAWMTHVKKTMRANKGKPLSAVLKMAAKSYKKTAKVSKKKKSRGIFGMYGGLTTSAGPGSSTAASVGGRRSRKSKKNGSKKY